MSPKAAFCKDCVALQRAFLQAVAEYRQLEALEVEATVSGRVFCLTGELSLASKRRQEAKMALIGHATAHADVESKTVSSGSN
jgi:hypothetical protein